MPTAVLIRTTRNGTIELSVSDRAAVHSGVGNGSGWEREHRPRTEDEWSRKIKGMNAADAKREQRRRRREKPMSAIKMSAETVIDALALEPDDVAIDARRGKAAKPKKGAKREKPTGGAFWVGCVQERGRRETGESGWGGSPGLRWVGRQNEHGG